MNAHLPREQTAHARGAVFLTYRSTAAVACALLAYLPYLPTMVAHRTATPPVLAFAVQIATHERAYLHAAALGSAFVFYRAAPRFIPPAYLPFHFTGPPACLPHGSLPRVPSTYNALATFSRRRFKTLPPTTPYLPHRRALPARFTDVPFPFGSADTSPTGLRTI